MVFIEETYPTLNGSIVFLIKNRIGQGLEYDSICALLDAQGHLMTNSDLLYANSTYKDSFGICSNEDETVHGPMCPNDEEEMQFWEEKFFEMEYFIIHLDKIDIKIQTIEFFMFDYEKYNGASKDLCTWSWKDCGVEIFQINQDCDILGKNTVVYGEPVIWNIPKNTSFR